MANLFQIPTKAVPKSKADAFIVRTPMTQNEIGGRQSHIPKSPPGAADIVHVANKS